MTIKKQLKRHLGKKTTKRIYNALPWVGGAAALAAGVLVQRRGFRGAIDDVRGFSSSMSDPAADESVHPADRERNLAGSR